MGVKVLVTGGAGFIGSHIVDLLVEEGYETVVIDNFSSGYREYLPTNITCYEVDVTSLEIEQIFQKEQPTYVIHQAAQINMAESIKDPLKDANNNIMGTIHVLTCCHKYGVRKIVYPSSCAVYGETGDCSITEDFPIQPLSFYGISKFTPEMYLKSFHQLYGLPYTILRYSNVYGPRQTPKGEGGVVSIFSEHLLKGESPVIYGDGDQTRDFVYVKDVAAANFFSLTKGDNETLNISQNEKTSINQLFSLMNATVSTSLSPTYLPARDGDIKYSRLDNSKAMQVLEWVPSHNFPEGLTETLYYYQKKLHG